jgi:hypothetical protein
MKARELMIVLASALAESEALEQATGHYFNGQCEVRAECQAYSQQARHQLSEQLIGLSAS